MNIKFVVCWFDCNIDVGINICGCEVDVIGCIVVGNVMVGIFVQLNDFFEDLSI